MKVTLDHIEEIASNIKTYWFKSERPVRYTPGQYIQLTLPHDNTDNRANKRWFTLTSSPTEDLISITTRFSQSHESSFKHALKQLQPGDEVLMSEPMGDFVLPKDPKIEIVFVAGGIGITPYRSMVQWLHDRGEQRKIQLIYGVRSAEDIAFRDVFERYDLQLNTVFREPAADRANELELLSAQKVISLIDQPARKRIYLAGPEIMVERLFDELPAIGINKSQLVTDYFSGYEQI
ncbi:MAG: hypothetical protein JWL85_412 [Candidatus Saccharibacteria bacterium]|nr:hypothetical protein [Candidatus Saccharibacteria bacterium]